MPATVRCRTLLACAFIFALAGCFGKKDESSTQSASTASAGGSSTSTSGSTGSGSTTVTTPTVTDALPDYTPTTGALMTLRGRNFVAGAKVFVGTAECTAVSLVSANELACKVPTLPIGSYDIIITNLDKSTFTLAKGFTVSPAPTVTSITPATQAIAGGTEVTIVGTGFLNGAKVQIGAVVCANPKVVSATNLTCVAGASIEGQYTVYVRNPDQQFGGLLNAFTYGTANSWRPMAATTTVDSTARDGLWTGSGLALISKGFYARAGSSVSLYTPVDDKWTQLTTGGTLPDNRQLRSYGTVLAAGKLFMWGGFTAEPPNCTGLNSGGVFDFATGNWKKTLQATNTPFGRSYPSVVSTGAQVIVWGGLARANCTAQTSAGGAAAPAAAGTVNSGAIYDVATDTWKAMSQTNAPSGRYFPAALWTGSKLVVWGGYALAGGLNPLNDGGIYDPQTNTWTKISATNAPEKRAAMTSVWTGTKMIVWGGVYSVDLGNGLFGETIVNTGAIYDLATDTWTAMVTTGQPAGRAYAGAVWTGNRMVVWGGRDGQNTYNAGGVFNPATNSWSAMSATNGLGARLAPTAVWSGSRVLYWGGADGAGTNFTNAAAYIP